MISEKYQLKLEIIYTINIDDVKHEHLTTISAIELLLKQKSVWRLPD